MNKKEKKIHLFIGWVILILTPYSYSRTRI